MEGYIKLYRELLEKPIWKTSTNEQRVVLITLLLMANHKETEWEWNGQKFKVLPGQFVTSLQKIAARAGDGISEKNVRSALLKFEKLEFLANESSKTGRRITILNWGVYQVSSFTEVNGSGNDMAGKRQRGGKEVATNNNDNNEKNIYTPQFEVFYKTHPNPREKRRTYRNWLKCINEYSAEEIINATMNYKIQTDRENREMKYIKSSANFLGNDKTYLDYFEVDKNEKIVPLKLVIK